MAAALARLECPSLAALPCISPAFPPLCPHAAHPRNLLSRHTHCLQLRPIEWANIVFISAKTGQRVKRVLDAATAASEEHRRRITTSTMNLVLREAQVCMAAFSLFLKLPRLMPQAALGAPPPPPARRCQAAPLLPSCARGSSPSPPTPRVQGWRMPATTANGRRGRIYYGTQARACAPPLRRFVFLHLLLLLRPCAATHPLTPPRAPPVICRRG